jgi:hypothetical protein
MTEFIGQIYGYRFFFRSPVTLADIYKDLHYITNGLRMQIDGPRVHYMNPIATS